MAKSATLLEKSTVGQTLEDWRRKLAKDGFELTQETVASDTPDEEAGAIVYGRHAGVETPRVFLLAVVPEHWDRASADHVQQQMWALTPTETAQDLYSQFAVVTDGEHEKFFELAHPPYEIDKLPSVNEIGEYKRLKQDPTYRWSMRMYERLMNGFNNFHEQVYHTVKDNVADKNGIIEELSKLLFLESFRLHHAPETLDFPYGDQKLNLVKVFNVEYVKEHRAEAIAQIQAAFDFFKSHEDYTVTDDTGARYPIFGAQTHLMLNKPENYITVLDLLQNLGAVKSNENKTIKTNGTLSDISADVLGRVFDVFLRANFDSKGGLGVYLTPAPVKIAMLKMAFHDIKTENPEILTAKNADGTPAFRYCDPACGSYGFGAIALGEMERALSEILSLNTSADEKRNPFLQAVRDHSFYGADASPRMVTLARVNMALLGAPKANIFLVDSLETDNLKAGSFDLICTNPPFGTPKFGKNEQEGKKNYEAKMEKILQKFRSDLSPRSSKAGMFDYEPTVTGLAMGGSPDGKGVWKPVSPTGIDPAVLFIDRCLQLLKPGGRLFIILPDGVLCNSGDRYVREYLMGKKDETTGQFHGGKAIVKAVISLPSDTFKLSGTGAKTSILYVQKRKARNDDREKFQDEAQTDVFMAVADTLGYVVKNNVEDYSTGVANDLAAITGAYVRGE